MKRGCIVLLFCVMGSSVTMGQASISVGAAFPLAPERVNNAYATGIGLSAAFGLSRQLLFTPRVVAGFDVIQTDKDFLREVSEEFDARVEGGDLSTVFAGLDLLFMAPPGPIRPYIAPGAGLAIISVDEFTVRDIPFVNLESEQGFAVAATAGSAFRLAAGPHLLIEARLVHAFTERDGVTWMRLHAGIAFDLD